MYDRGHAALYRQQRDSRKAIRLGFWSARRKMYGSGVATIMHLWRHWQRAIALLAGVGCAVFIIAPAPSAALALRPRHGQGVREAWALRKEPPDGGSLLANRTCWALI